MSCVTRSGAEGDRLTVNRKTVHPVWCFFFFRGDHNTNKQPPARPTTHTSSWPISMLGNASNSCKKVCQKSSKATSSYPRAINAALLKDTRERKRQKVRKGGWVA